MAIPNYTTDLIDITLDSGTFSVLGGGRVTIGETDDFFQGLNCWSHDPFSSGTEGGAFNSAQTITAGNVALIWAKCDVAATLASKVLGGVQAVIGNTASDYKTWYMDGFDTYAAGGWKCYAIDPTNVNFTPVGTPTTVTNYFGMQWYVPATGASKGYPMKIDAIRQGRAEILVNGGETGSLATFAGMALANDAQATKWGLFEAQEAGKAGYRWKGLMSFGPTTLTEFTDTDINIVIEDTEYVSAAFNRIEFNNASSIVNWTNISITAIGTVSRGELAMIDNCTLNDTGGVFTGMSTFVYQSGATIIGRTWRGCELVTQGGATITSGVFDSPSGTVGLLVDNLALVTKSTFNSDGTGHGVNLGTISTTQSLNWDNFESGYAATNGSTGNETILVSVDTGITLTINVQTGASTPTIYNTGLGTVSVVAGLVTADWTVNPSITGFEYAIYTVTASGSLDGAVEVQHVESTLSDAFSYTYTYSAGVVLAVQILDDGTNDFEENISYYPLSENNQSFTIGLDSDTNN